VSGCECTEEAVDAEADGEAVGLPAMLGGLLLAGAAIFLAFCVFLDRGSTVGRVLGWPVVDSVWRRRCLAGKKPRCFIEWLSKQCIFSGGG
jgi:hypothetical protein